MRCAIAVFAKSPMRGQVKTRLCPPLTPDQATELYRAFLADTLTIIGGVAGVEPGALFTPADAHGDFRAMAPEHFFLVPQAEGGFGERLAGGFRDLFALGYESVAIMDADSPTLPRAHIAALFGLLNLPGCDVALGPCDDGGYWAIGMKRLHAEVLGDIAWSTDVVTRQTLARAHAANLSAACAPTWYDVDNANALTRLRAELRDSPALMPLHTLRAMAALPPIGEQIVR
ncbi:MAG: TIGR04282 family arsenosugar biosynthesis glycosyltransferase [Chloroflexi bacterium]|nr:TIGR04282 family arsenosugar biosynthesis glycosyltransferase [Chloroflexota bacterium]MBI3733102.1 TIGR04282 family arsenosugar biosynthesis glycosyltransferase [Chloroflexota bacterium]